MNLLDPMIIDLIIFALLGVLAIAFSILVVEHRSIVYGIIALGFLGMVNAALFSMLGFAFVGLFHIAVYVGAGVIFILFSLTLFGRAPVVEESARRIAMIIVPLIVLALVSVFWTYADVPVESASLSYEELSEIFTQKYWFPFIVLSLALVTTLIEGITLARKEED